MQNSVASDTKLLGDWKWLRDLREQVPLMLPHFPHLCCTLFSHFSLWLIPKVTTSGNDFPRLSVLPPVLQIISHFLICLLCWPESSWERTCLIWLSISQLLSHKSSEFIKTCLLKWTELTAKGDLPGNFAGWKGWQCLIPRQSPHLASFPQKVHRISSPMAQVLTVPVLRWLRKPLYTPAVLSLC